MLCYTQPVSLDLSQILEIKRSVEKNKLKVPVLYPRWHPTAKVLQNFTFDVTITCNSILRWIWNLVMCGAIWFQHKVRACWLDLNLPVVSFDRILCSPKWTDRTWGNRQPFCVDNGKNSEKQKPIHLRLTIKIFTQLQRIRNSSSMLGFDNRLKKVT